MSWMFWSVRWPVRVCISLSCWYPEYFICLFALFALLYTHALICSACCLRWLTFYLIVLPILLCSILLRLSTMICCCLLVYFYGLTADLICSACCLRWLTFYLIVLPILLCSILLRLSTMICCCLLVYFYGLTADLLWSKYLSWMFW